MHREGTSRYKQLRRMKYSTLHTISGTLDTGKWTIENPTKNTCMSMRPATNALATIFSSSGTQRDSATTAFVSESMRLGAIEATRRNADGIGIDERYQLETGRAVVFGSSNAWRDVTSSCTGSPKPTTWYKREKNPTINWKSPH